MRHGASPFLTLADRFRLNELRDYASGNFEPRVTRWSEASEDIRALRKLVKDGPLSVEKDSRNLLTVSLAAAKVLNDSSGNTRMVKSPTNRARDDVAAGLLLAAGAMVRYPAKETEEYASVLA